MASLCLVIHPPVEPPRLETLRAAGGDAVEMVNAADESAALAAMPRADAFFGKLTPNLLAAAGPRLRWVQAPTASLEHYVFPELVAHPCVLTNMRGLFSDVIADHVMGFVLCFARHFHTYIRQQSQGRWEPVGGEEARSTFTAGPGVVSAMDLAHRHLADCTLGVVGLGAIGREVAHRGAAFGMRVVGVDPLHTAVPQVEQVWPPDELPQLLAASDFVVIAAPHTPQTKHMFRRPQLQQMKRSAYLINVGRGVIVHLEDLTAALQAGEIAGAGMDVLEVEPLPPDHPLWRLPNVILTPHVAGASPRIAQRHLEVVVDNLRRFAADQPLRNVVDKAQWF